MHRYLLHNGDIRDARDAVLSPGQVGFLNGWGVFSTLRVSDGVLFAFERHYERMRRDAEILRVPFSFSPGELHRDLTSLIDANRAFNATLRVAIVRNRGGMFEAPQIARDADLIAFTADLRNWGAGVHLKYIPEGRHGASPFAGLKIASWAQNLTWYEKANAEGYDEVVLLNEHGHVSECTSANIFVVHGSEVLTPPLAGSGCLPGVTRAILLEEIHLPGLTIREETIAPKDLETAASAFITSSTRDIVSVATLDKRDLRQSPELVAQILGAFRGYRSAYVLAHSRKKETLTL